MKYVFAIEKFDSDESKFEILEKVENLDLLEALGKAISYIKLHEDGYLLESDVVSHPFEYELDGAELSCWIDFMDE